MITEFALAGLITYCFNKYNNRDINKLKREWENNLLSSSLQGIRNKDDYTFEIFEVYRKSYGYFCLVSIPSGLSFDKLESCKDIIQDKFKCLCEMEKDKFTNYAKVKLITDPLNNIKYEPVPQKPYQLLLGYKFDGSPMILDLSKTAHLLIGGRTGSGKSRAEYIILTNLIATCNEKQIEIYLLQVRKKELNKFKNCKQVKFVANKLNETEMMLKRLDNLIQKRSEIFDEHGMEDIKEYNCLASKKMKYIHIFIDEFSFYMPSEIDNEEEKELKGKCLAYLKNIVMSGRSTGVFLCSTLQRSTVDNIPSSIKSQMNRLSFAQKSKLDSLNLIDIDEAATLQQQECILNADKYYYLKTPFIDIDIMKNYVSEIITAQDVQESKVEKKTNKKEYIDDSDKWRESSIIMPLADYKKMLEEQESSKKVPVKEKDSQNKPKSTRKRTGVISLEEVRESAN